ncbi:hypothetical protein MNBD_BACTEROID01-1212, partial [hydrothermal vent metagenome]
EATTEETEATTEETEATTEETEATTEETEATTEETGPKAEETPVPVEEQVKPEDSAGTEAQKPESGTNEAEDAESSAEDKPLPTEGQVKEEKPTETGAPDIPDTKLAEEAEKATPTGQAEDNTDTATEEKTKGEAKQGKGQAAAKKKPAAEEKPDYSKFSQVELVNALRALLDSEPNWDIKYEVEIIKSHFYKLFQQEVEEQKKKFLEEGGAEEEFKARYNPYEQDIKDLLKRYRIMRIEFNKKQETVKEENLQKKYQIIEEIKNLINNEESINKTFQDFRDLQIKWREIGLVPQSKMKDLWETYHFHVENFYDYIKINRELRDLDLRKNLEIKINLCERAEELLVEPSIIKAFNTLQKYHEHWRETGPVPRDKKDEIWERFKAATSKINKKHQEFFENRKIEQKKNLEAKTALCEKVEEIANKEYSNLKEWDENSKKLIELQKIWRTIGFTPKRDNTRIYERFRTACDKFFDSKREFFAKNKELQQNNLQMKIDLCIQAESLKESTDWKKTTWDFVNIQKEWKKIGAVPRKHSEAVWKRFRAACDYFFDKKSEHFSSIDEVQSENMKQKEQLVEEVDGFKPTGDIEKDMEIMKDFQRRWTEIGHVPFRHKESILNKFREAINKHFDELELDYSRRNILKFRNKVSNFSESSRGQNKMRFERDKYMSKLKQLENDVVLLENNIGFFTQSKNAELLIADVKQKIKESKEKIELLKDKIRIIDEYDQTDE